ncbi:MAG: hypothetical protein AB1486_02525 [Planctomycetota bacterium]
MMGANVLLCVVCLVAFDPQEGRGGTPKGAARESQEPAQPAPGTPSQDKSSAEPRDRPVIFSKGLQEEIPAPSTQGGPLRTDFVLKEFARMDRDQDEVVTYLEARDLGVFSLAMFREVDTDGSGGLNLLELETYYVLSFQSQGLPVERSLELRVKSHVEELQQQREEEAAKKRPDYLEGKVREALLEEDLLGRRRPVAATMLYRKLLPQGPRPRSPYHPRYHGF